jgi:hypothetical protein
VSWQREIVSSRKNERNLRKIETWGLAERVGFLQIPTQIPRDSRDFAINVYGSPD